MNLFEKATRKKLRFESEVGLVSVEDLWDMKLEALDRIAQHLHAQVKDGETVSFIDAPNTSAAFKEASSKFDVVKRVIEVRLADKQRAEKAAASRAKKQRILELIEKKKGEELEGKSLDELEALLSGNEDDES